MALLKYIFIVVMILWIIRILIRLIFPVVLRNAFGNVQNQAAGQQQTRSRRPEGSISIDYMPKKEKKGNSDKLGDFVEYEEVK